MGVLGVRNIESALERRELTEQLLGDIETLERIFNEGFFEKGIIRIGAEQEFCLVNEDWEPTKRSQEVLKSLKDDHFTTELALCNLEANLDPIELTGTCFSQMHKQLDDLMQLAEKRANEFQLKTILTGILPTIATKHLHLSYMTPLERYKALNRAITNIRKEDIDMHIKGADELNLRHDSILYESCNTSFQAHLQIDPDDFDNTYNWAQAIAGPILSICANSPLLMGRELWEETRIALFTQSIDTRVSSYLLHERDSRVSFGKEWEVGGPVNFYKEAIVGFRSILTSDFETDSMSDFEAGNAPKLKALNLHSGTVYRWNRLCYGRTEGKPHLRIECRYIPSGPSTADEIANMMFWTGVMVGRPKEYDEIHKKMDFKDIRGNFFNAARYGMAAQFYWNNSLITAQDMILNLLLPMAYRGLYAMKVSPKDVERYLPIIENRVKSMNGSRWAIQAFRKFKKEHKTRDALRMLVASMHEKQQKKYPVDAWQLPSGNVVHQTSGKRKVGDQMSRRTITAQDSDSALLVLKMMEWKNIHHLPILNDDQELVGLLTWTDVLHHAKTPEALGNGVSGIMRKKLLTTTEDTPLQEADALMKKHAINCLPVVHGKKLVGIISTKDL